MSEKWTPEVLDALKREIGDDAFFEWFRLELLALEARVLAADPTARVVLLGDSDRRMEGEPRFLFIGVPPPPGVHRDLLTDVVPAPAGNLPPSRSSDVFESAPATTFPPTLTVVETRANPNKPWRGSLPYVDHAEHSDDLMSLDVLPPHEDIF